MIKRILISNRGEIALRIIRACQELGIETVAIYSEADRYALHVKRASKAQCMGEDPLDAYLNINKIVACAKAYKVDAIHPGYGFLSENADFAKTVEKANIKFIGPSSKVIATMGSKVASRASKSRTSYYSW